MPVTSPQGTLDFKKVDKITFVGASSNTVIDTTTGSVGIGVVGDALSSNLHVVGDTRMEGNINMLHTSNTASIKLNSNVVTEFPRSKKLIKYPRVALTSAAQTVSGYEGYFTSQDSSTLNNTSSRQAWGFFDSVTNPNDASGGPHIVDATDRFDSSGNYIGGDTFAGISGDWITIQLPVKIQLSRVHTWSRYGHQRNPVDATILGSLDGTNWTTIALWSGRDFIYNHPNPYDIQTNEYYNYFAFVFEKIESSSSGKYINFNEIELFGVPEYDPEAHGTDVVVKSVANVPNTDWLEVYYDAKNLADGTTTVNDLKPVGTAINGTANGNTTVSNGAFTFDEADDYITLDTGKTGNYIFSVSLWFKSSGNSVETLFHMNGDYATNNTVWLYGSGTSLSIDFVNNNYSCDIGKEIADNIWHHASFVYNGNGESGRDIYLDGIRLGGSLGGSNAGDNLNLTSTSSISRIGALNHSSGIIHEFKGSIANFRLFNRAITSDEVWQLYAYQREYFGHGDLSMTLKAGRLGIGTSEPRAALDVRGTINATRFNTLVAEYTVTSTADSVEFTGLNLIGDGGTYKILWKVKNPVSGNPQYYMTVNGDTTEANYWYGGKQHTNTEGLHDGNYPTIFRAGSSSTHTLEITMTRSCDGYIVAHGQGTFHTDNNMSSGSVQGWELNRWFYKIPGNVTSILFSSANTSSGKYGSGSNIQIHKYM